MIQLEYGVKVDNKKYVIIMDDDEMDAFEEDFEQYSDLKAIFLNQDVLLSHITRAITGRDKYIYHSRLLF